MSSQKNKTLSLHLKLSSFLRSNSKRLKTLASEVRAKTSAKKVHKLRIMIRKIRTTLSVMEVSPESKRLKHLAKTLGDLRDIDVAILNSRKFHLKDKHLQIKRKSYRRKVKESLRKDRVLKLTTELKVNEGRLAALSDSKLRRNVAHFKKELLGWKGKKLTFHNAHDFRKMMKRVKYFFEALSVDIVGLEKLHKCLGELHDLIVLTDLSGRHGKIQKVIHENKKKVNLLSKSVLQSSLNALNKI